MKCPEPGCGKRGLRGHQGVQMHIARVHTRTIVSPTGPRGPRKPREPIIAIDGASKNGRHAHHEHEQAGKAEKFELNGCPNCLFPLRIMNDALAAEDIPIPPYCPNCTMPIEIVRNSLTVANKHKQLV